MKFLFVYGFTLMVASLRAEPFGYKSVQFSEFQLNGRSYLLGTLSSQKDPGSQEERLLAQKLVPVIEGWVKSQYIRSGVPQEFVHQILQKEPLNDGRSELIFVTEKEDLGNVKATLRFSFATPDFPLLPLEQRLGIRLPRPPPSVRENFVEGNGYAPLWNRDGSRSTGGKERRIMNRVEIKSLIADKSAERDFLPLLWLAGETEIATSALFVGDTKSYLTENRCKPGNYVAETNDTRARIYRTLDFKPVENSRVPDPDYPHEFANVLSVTREDYSSLGDRKFSRRDGKPLTLNELTPIQGQKLWKHWDTRSCFTEQMKALLRE